MKKTAMTEMRPMGTLIQKQARQVTFLLSVKAPPRTEVSLKSVARMKQTKMAGTHVAQ